MEITNKLRYPDSVFDLSADRQRLNHIAKRTGFEDENFQACEVRRQVLIFMPEMAGASATAAQPIYLP